MTGITSLTRDWGTNPSIVRMTSTEGLAAITTAGYLIAQEANIIAINFGPFEWNELDYVLANYDAGAEFGFFVYDAATGSLTAASAVPGSLANTLASGRVFVGSAGNVATGVAMSADATMANTGALTIAANAITTGKIIANAVTSAKMSDDLLHYVAVPISAAEFNGMYAAPKVLVAAPGANKLLVLDKVQLLMTYGSANYAAGGVAAVQYDVTANGAGVIASTTLAAATFQAAASTGFNFNAGVVAETFTTCVNKSLALSNITAAFTTGDSDMVAHIWYKIIPTA